MGDAVNPIGPGAVPDMLGLAEPAAQDQPGEAQHAAQGQQEKGQKPYGGLEQILGAHGNVMFPHAAPGRTQHQQTVIPHPASHRIVLQIPAGKGGHIPDAVFLRHILRFAEGPAHPALFVQQHEPLALLQQLLPGKTVGRTVPDKGVGNFRHRGAPVPAAAGVVIYKGQKAQQGHGDNQQGGDGYQYHALHQTFQLHGLSSRLSR